MKKKDAQTVSSKLRFEIFKRDSFKCQYCGESAPNVLLHVDHIKPVREGGTSDISNLITACSTCNIGKGGVPLEEKAAINKRKSQLDEIQSRREQLEMMSEWANELQKIKETAVNKLKNYWEKLTPRWSINENGINTLRNLYKKYPYAELTQAMDIAANKYLVYQSNKITDESVANAFNKIGGILYVRKQAKENPDYEDLQMIRGLARYKCPYYFSNWEAMDLINAAWELGAEKRRLREIAGAIKNWTGYKNAMLDLIIYLKKNRND